MVLSFLWQFIKYLWLDVKGSWINIICTSSLSNGAHDGVFNLLVYGKDFS